MAKKIALLFGFGVAIGLAGLAWVEIRPPGSSADRTLLEVARKGDLSGIKAALSQGANPNFGKKQSLLEQQTAEFPDAEAGYTALHYAAISGKLEGAKALVEAGAKLDARTASGNTPLMLAVGQLDVKMVKFFLSKGADPAVQNGEGKTATAFAQKRAMTDDARLLLSLLERRKS